MFHRNCSYNLTVLLLDSSTGLHYGSRQEWVFAEQTHLRERLSVNRNTLERPITTLTDSQKNSLSPFPGTDAVPPTPNQNRTLGNNRETERGCRGDAGLSGAILNPFAPLLMKCCAVKTQHRKTRRTAPSCPQTNQRCCVCVCVWLHICYVCACVCVSVCVHGSMCVCQERGERRGEGGEEREAYLIKTFWGL